MDGEDAHRGDVGGEDDAAEASVRMDKAARRANPDMQPPAPAIEEEEVAVLGRVGGDEARAG